MKMKSKRRWLASLMAFVMLTSALPVTAFAEGHTHIEECYAKEGDLLCKISESEGHTHTSECVCPGGEYICGLEETEGHTHNESCYDYIDDEESDEEEATPSNAVQKKLVCGLEEQEGHTHTSECVCPGGEYICGLEEIESRTHDESCYDYIEDEESDEEEATPSNAVKSLDGSEAAIGETNYDTLQEAINSAQDGDTIKVLREIVLTKDTLLTIAPDKLKEITIDLNQNTISYPKDGEWKAAALTISKPATLKVINGTIDVGNEDDNHIAIKITCAEKTPVDLTLSDINILSEYAAVYTDVEWEETTPKNLIFLENVDINSDRYGINAQNADITFEGKKITTRGDETFYLSYCSLTINDGEFLSTEDNGIQLGKCTATINGGHFKSNDEYGAGLDLYDGSQVTLNGGTFEAPEKAIDAGENDSITIGENLKTILADGSEDFMNSPYVKLEKIIVTVTFISDGQKVAEVLVKNGQSISGDDLTDQSMPEDPQKNGYIFKGWWTNEDGTGEAFTDTAIVTNDLTVYAKLDEEAAGTLTISKTVSGTGTPDADTLFEFTVAKEGTAASGQYSVDGGAPQAIMADGKIGLKAGQSALLTGLEPGEYTVTETTPAQANYKSTTFSVNGEPAQNGCTAAVTVSSTAAASGGWKKEGGNLVTDDDGYFTYTLTADQIDADGNITVDCDLLAEYVEAQMQAYQNYAPRSFKVKFVNETGAAIRYQDYEFDTVNWIPVGETYTPSGNPTMKNTDENSSDTSAGYGWGEAWQQIYDFMTGQTNTAGALDADGFDGNKVRTAIAPLRCINPAVVSYFSTNPGLGALTGNSATNSAQTITLQQMNALPELIKQEFTFKNWEGTEISLSADDSRTYADFICAFYGVDSLDKLTVAQKYNVLGTGYKGSPAMPYAGQSHITTYYSNLAGTMSNWCIPYAALNDGTLDFFKTWGFSETRIEAGKKMISGGQEFSTEDAATYAYQQDYYLLESDPEILSMAYEYLYDRCIRFSLDSEDRPVSTSIDNSAISDEGVGGIKDYMNKTEAATANVLKAMNNGAEVANGESITLDHVKGYIEVPNAWNQFRYYDFGFKLTFKADEKQPSAAAVAFINDYKESDTPTPPMPSEGTGNLIVSKIVSGNAGDTNKAFSFTVKLGNSDISGSYGEMTFANGEATFTLKHNEKKTATGLPAGISYEVTESEANQNGYTTTSTGANGSIVKDQTATAAFTNTKKSGGDDSHDDLGNLIVSKVVAGNAGDTNKAFSFTVKLGNSDISGSYGEMTFANGEATFTLKHNEKKTATGLPAGISYEVTESEANQNGYTTTATGANGSIVKDQTSTAAFTNTKKSSGGGGHDGGDSDDYGYGNLTVSKTVSGTAGDTAKAFTFTIKLDHSISGKYGDMTFDKGTATITLRHGESSTAKGLPSGIHYSVTESGNEGYTVNAVGDNGIIGDGKTVVAAFTNNKDATPDNPNVPNNPDAPTTPDRPAVPTDPVPQTGDESNVGFWLALMIISFAAFTGVCIYGRKRRYTGHHIQK